MKTLAILIDVQEKLFPLIRNNEEVLKEILTLVKGLHELQIPLACSEQYPKGLGKTVEKIAKHLPAGYAMFEKTAFGLAKDPKIAQYLNWHKPEKIVLFGIESHICVLQSALQLREAGFIVEVVTNAIGSRAKKDHETALLRMQQEGVLLTTTEAFLFACMKDSKHPSFKKISALIK